MSTETLFRVIVLISLVAGFGTRIYFHRRAGTLQAFIQDEKEGGVLLVSGLLTAICFVAIGFFIISPKWLDWSKLGLPVWLRWAGVTLSIVTGVFFVWIHQLLARGFGPTEDDGKDQSLIREGVYRWIRHPMYTAYFLGYLGYLLMTANWFIGLAGILSIILIMLFRVPEEEAVLIERFGDTYREYIMRTGRFLPRLPVDRTFISYPGETRHDTQNCKVPN